VAAVTRTSDPEASPPGGRAPDPAGADRPGRLTGSDAFRLHATLAAGLTLCVGAFTFELWRALGGHTFSWLYVFEWPLLAGFAIYMWWSLLHGYDRRPASRPSSGRGEATPTAAGHIVEPGDPDHGVADRARSRPDGQEPDPDLEAWNRYVARMEAEEAEEAAGEEGSPG
jgi:hypothetical protein